MVKHKPETMSIERRKILKAYCANLLLTEGKKGMKGAVDRAEELYNSNRNKLYLRVLLDILNNMFKMVLN